MRAIDALALIGMTLATSVAPRPATLVSEWNEANRIVSEKESSHPGPWRNARSPLLVEPMDCFSARSPVQDVVCKFPIQFGKTALEINVVGYTMCEIGGPIMVALPGQVSQDKWIDQKLTPAIEETPALRRALTTIISRESANRRTFKDFLGGQLYIEHAGNPDRLRSTSVRTLIVDEYSSFAVACRSGDDPDALLNGRTSGYPSTYKRLKVGTPGIKGICRIDSQYEASDQRKAFVPCPDCGHMQPLEWSGLQWTPDASQCWYVCRECGVVIEEWQKTAMIARHKWTPTNPNGVGRGYAANCLYYGLGMGPRWIDLVREFLAAQSDPAKLKTFVNDRLAEAWEDPAMRAVKHNLVADRVEARPLRPVPAWVLGTTVGVDTQDNRLAVHILGWGRGMTCWPIHYIELPGDPAEDAVWDALVDLLNRPIEREDGALLRIDAGSIDMFGHRTEAVKAFVRKRLVRRLMCSFGSKRNNAPVVGKGKLTDINWRGQYDKRGVHIHEIGVVAIKHVLYSWLSSDAEKEVEQRRLRFSEQLSDLKFEIGVDYFGGLTSEVYDPAKNRFTKRRGAPRNEPLDTWAHAYAATHHPELRMHRWTKADWDLREASLLATIGTVVEDSRGTSAEPPVQQPRMDSRGTSTPAQRGGLGGDNWSIG